MNGEGNISDAERELGVGRRAPHYYGDYVRRLFLAAALVMLVTLPFFKDFVRVPVFLYIFGMIFLGLVAGFTNPAHRWVGFSNVVISVFAILIFETEAISAYDSYAREIWYFWTNQILSLIFLAALYYSAKTERGKWFKRRFRDNNGNNGKPENWYK